MKALKPNHNINRTNQVACRFLKQTQKAIIRLNSLGFTVLNIDFTRIKPRIEVEVGNNKHIAEILISENKAYRYSFGKSEDLGRWEGYYTMLEGIRVCWKQSIN
ncbi:hypothetical protein [[Haemophilus] ducreyi]|uniref:hypothetical protein n=1 Tax=Haemophilus ducreyi TaxID=730 RepID=UPI000654E98C|nr:hypothetical protein [[Haemophilus] ducreyi]AKO46052.1 hypothetical protein RZ66_07645 [[Haemophilus] ducreyi]AKO47408.1 hypothetical protein RZ67_07410 [[Haemophilus] ducreyi]AKO48775.1 hypothetical protein RZ68_07490 [[Haemophilus] ducreyi]AKO49167.1 hypothetical protein RZ69_01770 [[Haemophilus] ducreyi]ANF61641.1 hypothetical protein A6037_02215 [[Haemophilus] ducreyi]